jgi:hypothetical protein
MREKLWNLLEGRKQHTKELFEMGRRTSGEEKVL